ncbi:hypothetical protein IFM89_014597 [Coptis chinensis]|uniref:Uncharacterized protein n=1 Tax=Coptis chinensis TaxID=261450 RepID=A0A835HHH5_9MAGN|nr:hypothetical protein IFM89_014597 [Coptis chinensis]
MKTKKKSKVNEDVNDNLDGNVNVEDVPTDRDGPSIEELAPIGAGPSIEEFAQVVDENEINYARFLYCFLFCLYSRRSTYVGRLPNASLLLNAPDFSSHEMSQSDHYSRVAAAIASRKRESNGLAASSYPCSKFPRSNLPHSRNVGGLLVPPQLSGRSNVVTEDLSKLFARRTT